MNKLVPNNDAVNCSMRATGSAAGNYKFPEEIEHTAKSGDSFTSDIFDHNPWAILIRGKKKRVWRGNVTRETYLTHSLFKCAKHCLFSGSRFVLMGYDLTEGAVATIIKGLNRFSPDSNRFVRVSWSREQIILEREEKGYEESEIPSHGKPHRLWVY